MSIQAMQMVWTQVPCSGGERLVLLCLADHVGNGGKLIAWPSIGRIAQRCQMSERGAQKAIRRLVEKGLLSVVEGGGRGRTNHYKLLLNSEAADTAHDVQNPERQFRGEQSSGVNSETKNPELRDTKPRTPVHPEPLEPKEPTPLYPPSAKREELNARPQNTGLESKFDEFWHIYPRKTAKTAAKKKFARLVRQGVVTVDELVAGAERYAQEVAGRAPASDGRIPICHPTTWLNQGRWEDETDAPAGDPTAGMTPEERERWVRKVEERRLAQKRGPIPGEVLPFNECRVSK